MTLDIDCSPTSGPKSMKTGHSESRLDLEKRLISQKIRISRPSSHRNMKTFIFDSFDYNRHNLTFSIVTIETDHNENPKIFDCYF